MSRMVRAELKFLLVPSLAADLLLWIVLLPFYGFCAEIPLGLIFGTAVMLANIYLLGYATERAVYKPLASAKRYMYFFYALRMLMIGFAFFTAVSVSWLNVVTTAIPTVYPRIFHTVPALFGRKRRDNE